VIKGIQDREKKAAYIIMNIFKRVVQRKHTQKSLRFTPLSSVSPKRLAYCWVLSQGTIN
jgi:hypothetical protein